MVSAATPELSNDPAIPQSSRFRPPKANITPQLKIHRYVLFTVRATVDWFIPARVGSTETKLELARIFVFTHIFGPLLAQPLWIYLYIVHPVVSPRVYILTGAICAFWVLPFILRATANMWLVSLLSFQGLVAASLYGSYHYGGFVSPFMPWLVVGLLLGLFYLSKNIWLVLTLFVANLMLFSAVLWWVPSQYQAAPNELHNLRWLSIASATVYMTWMANYYSTVVSFKRELENEAERSRATSIELERARAVAEAKEQARSRFFATMSHELRTPLHIIIGFSEILLEEASGPNNSNPQRVKDISRIAVAGKHLLSLVSRVLNDDVVQRDGSDLNVHPFHLGKLCDDIVANAQPMIEKNNNHFDLACADREFTLHNDAQKLRQIAINLLSNAGKFTKDGTVRFTMGIRRGSHDQLLQMTVEDTGIGIPSNVIPTLFTEYQQGAASIEAAFGGTGIGLSLSQKFANLLGGDICVRSFEGVGACFTVTVPTDISSPADSVANR